MRSRQTAEPIGISIAEGRFQPAARSAGSAAALPAAVVARAAKAVGAA
jgi:hypothetical protein